MSLFPNIILAKQLESFFSEKLQTDIQNLTQGSSKVLDKLVHIKEVFQIEDLSPNTILLAYINHQRSIKQNEFLLSKMKLELNKYITLNEQLENDIVLLET